LKPSAIASHSSTDGSKPFCRTRFHYSGVNSGEKNDKGWNLITFESEVLVVAGQTNRGMFLIRNPCLEDRTTPINEICRAILNQIIQIDVSMIDLWTNHRWCIFDPITRYSISANRSPQVPYSGIRLDEQATSAFGGVLHRLEQAFEELVVQTAVTVVG